MFPTGGGSYLLKVYNPNNPPSNPSNPNNPPSNPNNPWKSGEVSTYTDASAEW